MRGAFLKAVPVARAGIFVLLAGLSACGDSNLDQDLVVADSGDVGTGDIIDTDDGELDSVVDRDADAWVDIQADQGNVDNGLTDIEQADLAPDSPGDAADDNDSGSDDADASSGDAADAPDVPIDDVDSDSGAIDTYVSPPDESTCLAAGLCWIDAACRVPGARDPARPCWSCQPGADTGSWTVVPGNAACDDGNLETYDDVCHDGECAGTPVICPVYFNPCEPVPHYDGTANCNYAYPSGTSCDDGEACSCNDHCDGAGNCVATTVICAIIVDPCYPSQDCDGSSGCAVAPWPGADTSCDVQGGSGHCDGAGGCEVDSCDDGFVASRVHPGTCVRTFIDVSGNEAHTCGLTSGNQVYCWGLNDFGRLGDGTTDESHVPRLVGGLTDVAGISAGGDFTCAWTRTGAAYCWGNNNQGQLGNGGTSASSQPVQVTGLGSGVNRVSTGAYHACAVKTNGELWCWGSNSKGQIGVDSGAASFSTPQKVSLTVVDVDCGSLHTCAADNLKNVYCWGDNRSGQLGSGDTTNLSKPTYRTNSNGLTTFVGAGAQHSCSFEKSIVAGSQYRFELLCWGLADSGQLGGQWTSTCDTGICAVMPMVSAAWETGLNVVSNPLRPAVGGFHTCYVNTSGEMKCAGYNANGQIGNGTTGDPVGEFTTAVSSGVTAATAGQHHNCAVIDGFVHCWGRNTSGQLGNDTIDDRSVPTPIAW